MRARCSAQDSSAATWRGLRVRLAADAVRLRRFQESKFGYRPWAWYVDPAWWVVLLHRLSALAWRRGHRKTGRLFMQLNSLATGADIHPAADLGPGLLVPSPCGVTLSCKAGANLTVMALAGVGGNLGGPDIGAGPGLPVLGDGVVIGPFSGLQKAIRVGDGAVIEGGSGALKDVAPGCHMTLATAPLVADAAPARPPLHAALPPCPHHSWAQTRRDIAADIDRYLGELSRYEAGGRTGRARLSALLMNPVLATTVYRIAHWQHASGRPRLGRALAGLNRLVHRVTITSDSCIGGGLFVPHLGGTVFCGTAGQGLSLYANSLCAPVDQAAYAVAGLKSAPLLGDNVMVGGHAAVIGPVVVGSRVRVATKLQAMAPIPDDADAFSPMGRFVEQPGGSEVAPEMGETVAPCLPWAAAAQARRDALRADLARLDAEVAPARRGWAPSLCVRLHRLAHALHARGWRRGARWAWLANQILTGADISPASRLGPGLLLPYPAGMYLHATAGPRLSLLAQSGIGPLVDASGRLPPLSAAPVLGADVALGHHCGVFGRPEVGSRVRIDPGCIVREAVPDGTVLVARPMKLRRAGAAPAAEGEPAPSGIASSASARPAGAERE